MLYLTNTLSYCHAKFRWPESTSCNSFVYGEMKRKRIFTIFFLALFSLFSTTSLLALDKATLLAKIAAADTPVSAQEAYNLACNNPDILEEILFIKGGTIERSWALAILPTCVQNKKFPQERFLRSVSKLLATIETLVDPSILQNKRQEIISALGCFNSRQPCSLTDSLSSLVLMLDSFYAEGLIKDKSFHENLQGKVKSSLAAVADKQKIIKILESIIKETTEQDARLLTSEAASALNLYCNNMINQLSDQN